jgi:hypothetical protein
LETYQITLTALSSLQPLLKALSADDVHPLAVLQVEAPGSCFQLNGAVAGKISDLLTRSSSLRLEICCGWAGMPEIQRRRWQQRWEDGLLPLVSDRGGLMALGVRVRFSRTCRLTCSQLNKSIPASSSSATSLRCCRRRQARLALGCILSDSNSRDISILWIADNHSAAFGVEKVVHG